MLQPQENLSAVEEINEPKGESHFHQGDQKVSAADELTVEQTRQIARGY